MTPAHFIAAVRAMREAQKRYFATRSKTDIRLALEAEKQVDRMLESQ